MDHGGGRGGPGLAPMCGLRARHYSAVTFSATPSLGARLEEAEETNRANNENSKALRRPTRVKQR